MENLFSTEPINSGRQDELDFARGMAVFFMIAVHIKETFSSVAAKETLLSDLVEILSAPPAAPVFMFLLGVGLIYSRKNDPMTMIKRGVSIFFMGYLLNISRDLVPDLIAYKLTGDPDSLTRAIDGLILIDILPFAGLALMFIGFSKLKNFSNKNLIVSIIIFGIINTVLRAYVPVNGYIGHAITGLIYPTWHFAYFPFTTWITYPVAGYIWAGYFIRCTDKPKFYKLNLKIFAPIFLVSAFVFMYIFNYDILGLKSDLNYYQHNSLETIFFVSFVPCWLAMFYYISSYIPTLIRTALLRWSRNVTVIYYIHWVIIGWTSIFLGYNSKNIPTLIILFICVAGSSDFLAHCFVNLKKKNKEKIA